MCELQITGESKPTEQIKRPINLMKRQYYQIAHKCVLIIVD